MTMIHDLPALLTELTEPSPELVEFVRTIREPLIVVGASGKMGPTLCVLAKRAALLAGVELDVIGVARFSDAGVQQYLHAHDVRTISCDVMDRDQVLSLPDSENIVYMVGRKFGTTDNPSLTWAANTIPPLNVTERFPHARIVAVSTGCVYPMTPVSSNGSVESDQLIPLGEYANACVARERIFEYCSLMRGSRVCQIRLNYALDLRYGVFVDIAQRVRNHLPVDVSMGYVNCIWQRDANDAIIRSLQYCSNPPSALNLTGTAMLSVRELALRFGELLGTDVKIVGKESDTALLSNARRIQSLLGQPPTSLDLVLEWTAHWIMNDGETYNKPTHFETSDGVY